MIGGNFTTFGNNRLKLIQFSHTPELYPSFIAPKLKPQKCERIAVMGDRPLRGIDTNNKFIKRLFLIFKELFYSSPFSVWFSKKSYFSFSRAL